MGEMASTTGAGVSIQAVADVAGVSPTTVSHALSGKRPVAATTRRRVERVSAQLGYQPNYFAQALNRQRSNSLGLIVQDITNPFYPALARGLQSAVGGGGHVVMLFDAGGGDRLIHTFVTEAIRRRVDGVVIAVSDVEDGVAQFNRAEIPVVAVGSRTSSSNIDWVSADDERIAVDAVHHLHLRGHRQIATITGPIGTAPGSSRFWGFRKALTDVGIEASSASVAEADWTREGGRAAMASLLSSGVRPTAVFCANDMMAIGAFDALSQRGLSVPDDVAVVGVDDIEASALVRPALTTIRIPAEEIGRAAGELLISRMGASDSSPQRHVLVQHKLVIRGSTGGSRA